MQGDAAPGNLLVSRQGINPARRLDQNVYFRLGQVRGFGQAEVGGEGVELPVLATAGQFGMENGS